MLTVKFDKTVTAKQIADLMVGAIEGGGSAYWCTGYDIIKTPDEVVPNGVVVYSHPEFWAGDFAIVFKDGERRNKPFTIRREQLERGIQLMADNHAKDFWDWMEEQDDASTSDILVQLCCFGEVIYG